MLLYSQMQHRKMNVFRQIDIFNLKEVRFAVYSCSSDFMITWFVPYRGWHFHGWRMVIIPTQQRRPTWMGEDLKLVTFANWFKHCIEPNTVSSNWRFDLKLYHRAWYKNINQTQPVCQGSFLIVTCFTLFLIYSTNFQVTQH